MFIEKPILEFLEIDREAALDMRTDGDRLIISPVRKGQKERVRAALQRALKAHDDTIHEHEDLLIELRALRKTPEGRATLSERTAIEHRLARIGAVQGPRARYKGARKSTRRSPVRCHQQSRSPA